MVPQKQKFRKIGRWMVLVVLAWALSSSFLAYAEEMEFIPASVIQESTATREETATDAPGTDAEATSQSAPVDSSAQPSNAAGQTYPADYTYQNQAASSVLARDQQFLSGIRNELNMAQREHTQIESNIAEIEVKIEEVSREALSLKQQLSLLEYQIQHTLLMIDNVQLQISYKEGEIGVMANEIQVKAIEIQDLQRILAEYVQILYVQRNEYMDFEDEEFDRTLRLLFAEESVSTILQNSIYYTFLQEKGVSILKDIMAKKGVLQVKEQDLEAQKLKLQQLRYELKTDEKRFEEQKAAKERLLIETQGKEEIYQQLVAESKLQQAEIEEEIASLRSNVSMVQGHMKDFGEYLSVEDYRELTGKTVDDVKDDYGRVIDGAVDFRWPVQPSLGISAYYHDPSYSRVFGVTHNAIDLPVIQGTPVRAAEEGVVYKTKDNGYGYSYIVLAHKSGYMTLYGHISMIGVSNGEKVHQGQIIGLSGGTPGTKGAGYMTTGAHLHFEMFKGGAHIDPLSVLPLSNLPLKYVPKGWLPE